MANELLLEGINVLVVEDDKLNQKIVNFILMKKGAHVSMALNGNEAIEQLTGNKFDVVLMDLQMPVMDGYSASRHIRTVLHNDVPIIALTADAFANLTNDYLSAGMNACICKPVEQNSLCELILSLTKNNNANITANMVA